MWILRKYVPPKPLSVDLPFKLVHILGFGVNILVSFLENLSESVIDDCDSVPAPPVELCRICERYVHTWWFERHSEICLVEHKAQSDLDSAQENLVDQRNTISHLLALLDSKSQFSQLPESNSGTPSPNTSVVSISSSKSSSNNSSSSPKLEYRGIPLPIASQSPLSETPSPPRSPRLGSGLAPISSSKRMLLKSLSHPKRSPVKLLELLIELCDLAADIHRPELKPSSNSDTEGRVHSPQSESRIHRVLNWVNPNVEDPALALLCEDTVKYSREKVSAALRFGNTITYFETIRTECEFMVSAAIEDTVNKATQQREKNIIDSLEENSTEIEGDNEGTGDETDIDDGASLFSESYLNTESLPSISRHTFRRLDGSIGSSDDPRSNAQRSLTPRSLLSESINSVSSNTRSLSNSTQKSDINSIDPSESLDFNINDLDLNAETYNRLQKKKSFSNLSTYSSSSIGTAGLTSIQKNRLHAPDIPSPSTPLSSPLIFPHEAGFPIDPMHHRRQSSNTDMSRAPVSPLLTSSGFLPKPVQPSIKDYEVVTAISKGAFGSVYLAKKKNTGEYFAIKVLKKADMIAKNQVMNVRAERAIMMSQADSPFVAKLYFTFQSKNYLYLVMEYLNGGDCAVLVKLLGGLPEDWAKKYIAEVVLGVEDLHRKGIVHRDLKPDNLLINQEGHLKLTDFGLSRMGLVGRHTYNSISEGVESGGSSGLQSKSHSFSEGARPGSTSSASSITGSSNPLLDTSISLVPGYFNFSKSNPRLTRSDSNSSATGEAMFTNSAIFNQNKCSTGEDGSFSSNSSDAGISTPPNGDLSSKNIPLFDPNDTSKKFVGTPDYLAPETIRGDGQDEMSDWWSTGCILFEFLYGYPPFNAETPELVFEKILNRDIQWPELSDSFKNESEPTFSPEAKDLIDKLLCMDQNKRIGAKNGAEDIKNHPFFDGIDWDTLWDQEASFIPVVEDPESTDYFDSRGADLQAFPEDTNPLGNDDDKSEDSDDESISSRSSPAGSMDSSAHISSSSRKVPKLPLHIPPHVRENRSRRSSEPNTQDDFGSFSFKNLPMLDKANKDTLTRIKTENLEQRNNMESKRPRGLSISASAGIYKRPESPSATSITRHPSPVRGSPGGSFNSGRSSISLSPIITTASISSGPSSSASSVASPHRKMLPVKSRPSVSVATVSTSPLSIDCPKPKVSTGSGFIVSSPSQICNPTVSSPEMYTSLSGQMSSKSQTLDFTNYSGSRRLSNIESSPDLGEQFKKMPVSNKYHKVFDPSPSNSDTEDARSSALLRIQRKRNISRGNTAYGFNSPSYRPLIVLVCENNPVWRYSIETLLKGLNCRFVTVADPEETIRYATGDVKFDIIFTEFRLNKTNGADIARIVHSTSSSNTDTPVVCVTNFVPEAINCKSQHFAEILSKPITHDKLCDVLERHCSWKPKGEKPVSRTIMDRKGSIDSMKSDIKKKTAEEEPVNRSQSMDIGVPSRHTSKW